MLKNMQYKLSIMICSVFMTANIAGAGPFAPAPGLAGSTAIPMPQDPNDRSVFSGWATGIELRRGFVRIDRPSMGYVSHGQPQDALGPAQGLPVEGVVSLGDAGQAVLTFDLPVCDGPGYDFAVFENGFSGTEPNLCFLELAFVEVSSDGVHFERLPCISLTQTERQLQNPDKIDVTDVHNFAGKYPQGWGTPFDLQDVRDVNDLVNVAAITHIRLVDAVGCLQDPYARFDSLGNKINDPWRTDFPTGGFDLDAVGILHEKTLSADMDGNGIVNGRDFAVLSGAYMSGPSDLNWNCKADLDAAFDSQIDFTDVQAFMEQWLQTERWYRP